MLVLVLVMKANSEYILLYTNYTKVPIAIQKH